MNYRIEGSHFIAYAGCSKEVKGKENISFIRNLKSWICKGNDTYEVYIEDPKNYYFADDDSFNAYCNILKNHGYTSIISYDNVETDGKGNVIINRSVIAPKRFYKGINHTTDQMPTRIDNLGSRPSVTPSGTNRTWLISFVDRSSNSNKKNFISGKGRGGKFVVSCVQFVDLVTEASAKQFIRKHPGFGFKATSLIDYLTM